MGERARSAARGQAEGRCGRSGHQPNDRPASDDDLLPEDPEEQRQQLEGQRPREEDQIAVEMLAVRHALGEVHDHAFFEEIRLQRDHRGSGEPRDQRPQQHRSRRPPSPPSRTRVVQGSHLRTVPDS